MLWQLVTGHLGIQNDVWMISLTDHQTIEQCNDLLEWPPNNRFLVHNYQCSSQPLLKRLTIIHFICPATVGLLCGFTVYLIEIMCCIVGGVNQCASPNLSQHVGSYIGQVSVETWMSLGWVSLVVGHQGPSFDSQFFNSHSLLCQQITDISPVLSQCHISGSYYSSWSLYEDL